MGELHLVDEWISGFARERKCPIKNPRKRQIECHIKYDPKDKGKDIIYPFYFILLAIFSSICQQLYSTKVD